ncbi:hypothetical protein C8R44DRAFT_170202 [Mycena epipterygia]|nr:hypothetical protein C8R44DRAFT_170202 [Mycena epipterygia]
MELKKGCCAVTVTDNWSFMSSLGSKLSGTHTDQGNLCSPSSATSNRPLYSTNNENVAKTTTHSCSAGLARKIPTSRVFIYILGGRR